MTCLHCHEPRPIRSRRLCWRCYAVHTVREQYKKIPSLRSGLCGDNKDLPLCPWATDAQPGTPEKMSVMLRRAETGYAIFHPDDPERNDEITGRRGPGQRRAYRKGGRKRKVMG